MVNPDDTDYTSDSNDETWVPARLKGPRHEQIMECAAKIQKDFETYMENFHRKCKERPKEDQRKLLDEEPFHCDAIAEQQRLRELDKRDLAEAGIELEHKWEPKGYGIPVITIAEEARMDAALERKRAREERRRKKAALWNPDQKRADLNKPLPLLPQQRPPRPNQSNQPRQKEPTHTKHPIVVGKPNEVYYLDGVKPVQEGVCVDCDGPCFLDSRRALMSCTNEPMLPELMADLLGQFYRLGWMTGSGGAMAAISCDNRLLLSPSSLQKERIKACDLFASAPNSRTVRTPTCMPHGKPTACQGIFKIIMEMTGAQCVIHSHSKASNLATRLIGGPQFVIAGQEYIKGIYNFRTEKAMENDDILIVPIIENMPTEEALEPQVVKVLEQKEYAHISAILVRNHGVFVWGPTWQKAKIMAEIYDYLFDISIDLHKMGVPLFTANDLARAFVVNYARYGLPPPEKNSAIANFVAQGLIPASLIPEQYLRPSAASALAENQEHEAEPAEADSAPTAPPSSSKPSTPSAPPAEE